MNYLFDKAKNEKLKRERGIGFEDIIELIEMGWVIEVAEHPNQAKYPGQSYIELMIEGYAWRVACKFTKEGLVLKTAFPSRSAMKKIKKGSI